MTASFPGPTVALDFETYYAAGYSVADRGYYAYTHDPRFNAYLVAVHDGAQSWVGQPGDFNWGLLAGKALISHNAEFDRHVYERLVELGLAPEVPFAAWHCSAACCAYLQLPRDLAGAVQAVFGETVDKRQRAAARGKLPDEALWRDPAMLDYAADDARWCWRLWQELAPYWPEHERQLYRLTGEAGRHGLPVDREYLEASATTLSAALEQARRAVPWRPILSNKQFFNYCRQCGIEPPASTAAASAGFQDWLARHQQSAPGRAARAVQEIRRLNRTLKILDAMRIRLKPDGRLAYQLKYCGAGPGRWSGAAGLNVQNFNRGEVRGVSLRRVFACPPGRTFAIVDFAQIEARVLLWLAGDAQTLEIIRAGADLYEAHARATMGYADPRPLKEVDPKLRQLAKARCVGEGTLILTEKGYLPIENLESSGACRVWDGVDWVPFARVAGNGERPTIDLNGERFTPDHEVFIDERNTRPAGAIRSGLDARQGGATLPWRPAPGSEWTDLWQLACAVFLFGAREWAAVGKGAVLMLRDRALRFLGQPAKRQDAPVQPVRAAVEPKKEKP